MLSEKQKRVLFGTTIRRRPQYVRVPLQTVNGVHELKSDLQFERILPAYEVATTPGPAQSFISASIRMRGYGSRVTKRSARPIAPSTVRGFCAVCALAGFGS